MLSLHDANELLKSGYPAIPDVVSRYLEEHHTLPPILSELPAGPDVGSAQAAELSKSLGELKPRELAQYLEKLADFLDRLPYARLLKLLWCNSPNYWRHGTRVLDAMNCLLGRRYAEILGSCSDEERQGADDMLAAAMYHIRTAVFAGWSMIDLDALLRLAAVYHDIGKYIIKERHPTIGWFIAEYIDPHEKGKLRTLLGRDEYLQLLLLIIRDHDHFGVLNTGEASYPILLRTIGSAGRTLQPLQVVSALMLCSLADMAGTIDVDAFTIRKLVGDWTWVKKALDDCKGSRERFDEYFFRQASEIEVVADRIQRLLTEASRGFDDRRAQLDNSSLVIDALWKVFGSQPALHDFARQFTRVCKLDYGKRFFQALMQYCEGPDLSVEQKRKLADDNVPILPHRANERIEAERVIYNVLAILKRITTTYTSMVQSESAAGNLVGVEMKDLTPSRAPEKTSQIIALIVESHYPGLTWMVADVPAWFY